MEHRLAAKALPMIDPPGHRVGDLSGIDDESACSAKIVDAAPSVDAG